MTKKPQASSNEGIRASTVIADVLAVGRNARAEKTVIEQADRKKLSEAVARLDQELESLAVRNPQLADIRENAQELSRSTSQDEVDPRHVQGVLGRLASKLKEGGVVVKEVAGLIAPIKAIAGVLDLSLIGLGLL
jgi:signal recognition particle subunit SEC65